MREKRTLRGLLIAVLLMFWLVMMVGCAAPGRTADEIHNDHVRKFITENKQFQDDLDDFWMSDRPSRLSDKYIR